MRKNYLLLFISTIVFSACNITHEAVLGDAIRFSDDAVTSYTHKDGVFKNLYDQSDPYMLCVGAKKNQDDIQKMKNFLRRNDSGKATAGYYALDLGIDRVRYVRKHYFKHDHNTKYYIIYMTDGLDNTSVQVARNHQQLLFTTQEKAYAKHIQRKAKRAMGVFKMRQNVFKIFPMMFIGDDMKENMKKRGLTSIEDIKKAAADDMQYYRGASKSTSAPEVLLGTNFKEIAKDFKEMIASSGFEFYVPVGYRGQQVRMNLVNEEGEEIQIERKLKKNWFMWRLTDITYPSNVEIPDQRVLHRGKPLKKLYASNRHDHKATSAIFRMDDIKLNGKNYKVKSASQEHGKYYETNSEYEALKRENSDAYVLLIMDVSGSLGDQKKNEQDAMVDILDIVIKTAAN